MDNPHTQVHHSATARAGSKRRLSSMALATVIYATIPAMAAAGAPMVGTTTSELNHASLGGGTSVEQAASGALKPMVTIPTTRVADTRDGVGAAAAPKDDEVVDIQITGSIATSVEGEREQADVIPQGADAVVMNITAVGARNDGYFTLWPADEDQPSTSNINFRQGETVANGATVALSEDGQISVFARGGADLLLDISGYYLDGTYTPMAATRLHDSRALKTMPTAGSITHIDTGASRGDLVTLNLTTDYAAAPGYFSVWSTPADEGDSLAEAPSTSSLNYAPGMIVANTVEVKAGVDGQVSIYSHAEASLIVDQTHLVPSADADKVAVIYDAPVRTFDSRIDDRMLPDGAEMPRRWSGRWEYLTGENLPGGPQEEAQAVVINATVTNTAVDGYATLSQFIDPEEGQSTSTINYRAGETRANRVVVPLDLYGHISAYAHNRADIVIDVLGYIPASPLPPETINLDLTQVESTEIWYRMVTDMTNKRYLQMPINGQGGAEPEEDWVVTDETPLHIGPLGTEPIELAWEEGPVYKGEKTARVVYPGLPPEWIEHRGMGTAETVPSQDYTSLIRITVKNTKTGERRYTGYPVEGHYVGTPIMGSDIDPELEGSSVALPSMHAVGLLTGKIVVEVPAIEVSSLKTRVNVKLPESLVSITPARGIRVTSEEIRDEESNFWWGVETIALDRDGDNDVSFDLPSVARYNRISPDDRLSGLPMSLIDFTSITAEGEGWAQASLAFVRK